MTTTELLGFLLGCGLVLVLMDGSIGAASVPVETGTLGWIPVPYRYCNGRDCISAGGHCARPVWTNDGVVEE